jgi:hypothetical protein
MVVGAPVGPIGNCRFQPVRSKFPPGCTFGSSPPPVELELPVVPVPELVVVPVPVLVAVGPVPELATVLVLVPVVAFELPPAPVATVVPDEPPAPVVVPPLLPHATASATTPARANQFSLAWFRVSRVSFTVGSLFIGPRKVLGRVQAQSPISQISVEFATLE